MSIINNEEVLETAATLWEEALNVLDRPDGDSVPRGSKILFRLMSFWGISETRRLVASMAPACWAAWIHTPEDYRADRCFDGDYAAAWMINNIEGYARRAGLLTHRVMEFVK